MSRPQKRVGSDESGQVAKQPLDSFKAVLPIFKKWKDEKKSTATEVTTVLDLLDELKSSPDLRNPVTIKIGGHNTRVTDSRFLIWSAFDKLFKHNTYYKVIKQFCLTKPEWKPAGAYGGVCAHLVHLCVAGTMPTTLTKFNEYIKVDKLIKQPHQVAHTEECTPEEEIELPALLKELEDVYTR